MKYNIVSKEGEKVSATVFFGADSFIATKEHPKFNDIVAALHDDTSTDEQIKALFDISVPIRANFERLSERVMVNAGRIFFDGDEVDNSLSKLIARFYGDGHGDFMPLVCFMEKLATNPDQHSREQLFGWLVKHNFAITPDGDFIAYKGVDENGLSGISGSAIVNGVMVYGRIPNKPDTIIEMPRSGVQHDPGRGCAPGLHVANWRYASTWSGTRKLRIKVNPRDVVSVPTECNQEKMRVCRYRVLDQVKAEDKTALFVDVRQRLAVADAVERKVKPAKPAKPAGGPSKANGTAKKTAQPKEIVWPEYYEQYTKAHWAAVPFKELRAVAQLFEMPVPARSTREQLTGLLLKKARARKKTW